MAKPWARIEIGRMRHRKFLALTGNAIALWDEGKDYCDEQHTDGIIPKAAVTTFRFRSPKNIQMLTTSCGLKPDDTPYAPLWKAHPLGYVMHDYLEHNDCREAVLARMEDADDIAELRKEANKKRQLEFRARRKVELETLRNATSNVTSPPPTETETETETETKEERTRGEAPPAPRPLAPIHDRSHRNHVFCGRICLHASLFGEFVRRRNHADADAEIRDWCLTVDTEWGDGGPRAGDEPGDAFDFWKARYDEKWPATATPKADNRLPVWAQNARARREAKHDA